MKKVGVAFISDRDPNLYLTHAVKSFGDLILPTFNDEVEHVDTVVIDDRAHKLGMAGAVNAAWSWARETDVDYLLHVEEDFMFTTTVNIEDLVNILEMNPELAQVVLLRQPWNAQEITAGGIMQANPDAYKPHTCECGLEWTSHREIFSLNPCLIPRHIIDMGYPTGNEAEMTTILRNQGYEFAFYGHPEHAPTVHHLGHVRGNGWRL